MITASTSTTVKRTNVSKTWSALPYQSLVEFEASHAFADYISNEAARQALVRFVRQTVQGADSLSEGTIIEQLLAARRARLEKEDPNLLRLHIEHNDQATEPEVSSVSMSPRRTSDRCCCWGRRFPLLTFFHKGMPSRKLTGRRDSFPQTPRLLRWRRLMAQTIRMVIIEP